MRRRAIVLNERDNVANALSDFKRGESVSLKVGNRIMKVDLRSDIPFGHKFAAKDIPRDNEVIKYGEAIGKASQEINVGEHSTSITSSALGGEVTSTKVDA